MLEIQRTTAAPAGYVATGLVYVRHATYSAGYVSALLACASTAAGFSLSKHAVDTALGQSSLPMKFVEYIEATTMQAFHSSEIIWGCILRQADSLLGQYGISHEELLKISHPGSASTAMYRSAAVLTNLFRKAMHKGTIAELIRGLKRISAVHEMERLELDGSRESPPTFDVSITSREVSVWEWGFNIALSACGANALNFMGFLPRSMSDGEAITEMTGIEETLIESWSSDVYRPAHFVALDHARKCVVVSIRGTMELRDLLTDLVCEQADFSSIYSDDVTDSEDAVNGKVHEGFLKSASLLSEELKETVKTTLENNWGYSIFVCGHSLGAGVATLLTLIWARDPFFKQRSIRGIAYGAPCSVCPELASTPFTRKYITSIVLDDDFVSRLSVGSVTELWMKAINLGQAKSDSVEDHQEIANEIVEEAENLKLYPSGNVYHLPHNSTRDPVSFSRINISRSMFLVHMPNRYHAEILKVKKVVQERNSQNILWK